MFSPSSMLAVRSLTRCCGISLRAASCRWPHLLEGGTTEGTGLRILPCKEHAFRGWRRIRAIGYVPKRYPKGRSVPPRSATFCDEINLLANRPGLTILRVRGCFSEFGCTSGTRCGHLGPRYDIVTSRPALLTPKSKKRARLLIGSRVRSSRTVRASRAPLQAMKRNPPPPAPSSLAPRT